MKFRTLLIAFVVLSTTLHISCAKEDDDTESYFLADDIIGTWELAQTEQIGTKTTNNITENINTKEEPLSGDHKRITFKFDRTFSTDSFLEGIDQSINGTYEIQNNRLTTSYTQNNTAKKDVYSALIINDELQLYYTYKEDSQTVKLDLKIIETYKRKN